ncbi:polysaccharide deacetylase family protein [Ochrobactrum vermis]|uniref:Chitooligosaccharide deacetylase n=1 Tax=Ochrobactrum vermis TaxID=1827297 RepID=A0ABU8PAQ0_9HYPH|nr:polysaccharide deacetylase family protein [Ochrobactrum vermis]PQZ29047.1 polysaccharide deacetylase [Ochrobactrum vermis]
MPVPILLYHQIDVPPTHRAPYRSMIVHPARFRQQMAWLKRLGYRGLSLKDAIPYIYGGKQGKVVVITFDDGFENVFRNALPVLQEFGFTATNYFVANQIGGFNLWDQKIGVARANCMGAAELREWANLGHEVGSHTLDHIFLPEANEHEAISQIRQSRIKIEDLLGSEVTSFAYPYGGENAATRKIVEAAGYKNATTTEKRRARSTDDPFGIPRLTIRRNDILLQFLRKTFTR